MRRTTTGRAAAMLLAVMIVSAAAEAEPRHSFFWNIGENTKDSFVGWTSLMHAGAIGSTWLLVESGGDAHVQDWAREQNEALSIGAAVPALAGGMLLPIGLPLWLRYWSDDPETQTAGVAAGQAALIAYVSNTLMKAVTGRVPPDREEEEFDTKERSRRFRYGFYRGGVFDGWPSGHAMVNTAMATSLATYYSGNPTVQVLAYSWAAYVAASVVIGANGHVHWLSDGVAGVMMGWAIGRTVGKSFADGRARAAQAAHPAIAPVAGSGITGVRFTIPLGSLYSQR